MVTNIKTFFLLKYARLVYTGVSKDVSEEINLKTMFINRLNSIYFVNQLIQAFMFLFIFNYKSAIYCLIVLLGNTFLFYFHKKGKYLLSKVFIILYLNVMIFFGSLYFSQPLLSYYYLPVIVASTFIFNSKEIKYLFTVNCVSILLLLLENTTLNRYLPSYHQDMTTDKSNFVLLYGNISFILSLMFVYLYYINTKAKKLINLNKKLKESKKNLKEQSRDHFLFSEASNHFLKSPIYIFNAFIDKIENGIKENKSYEEMESYFSVIKHSIDEEEKFINNMFDYNKIILSTAKKKKTNVVLLIDKILTIFKNNNPNFNYTISEKKTNITAEIDEALFEKILLVIAENAYLYNNNPIKTLNIICTEYLKKVNITFVDNGIGINPVFTEKIFKPYVRLNTIENIPGTGIGLLKARKAAHLINANINLLNSSPEGSIFKLSINTHTNEENKYRFHRR